MSEDRSGRELTPREPGDIEPTESAVTPAPEGDSRAVERFSAGPQAHTVGLTEERSAQVVRQSANARNFVFLAILLIALFIPVYWFYEQGIPAVGAEGRLAAEAEAQYVTDVARGYELYIANCARCHGEEGQGGIGPPLSDQAKLYNAVTPDGQSGTGHLSPDYIDNVLTVGGRYICGDPNSLMSAWLEPNGPLNYRQQEELIEFLVASKDVVFEPYAHGGHGGEDEEHSEGELKSGWRDPNWEPEPGATPPPSCWKAPDGLVPASSTATTTATPPPTDGATPEPIAGGSTDEPRQIFLEAAASLQWRDESGAVVPQIEVVAGETIEFVIDNTSNFDHNFWIGPADVVSQPTTETEVGIPTWQSGVQTVTWTVEAGDAPLQFACTVPGHYTTMHGDIVIQG
jgi:mono/diheme cytochrome c family protein